MRLALWVGSALLLCTQMLWASEKLEVRMLVDTSGSMYEADKRELRRTAVEAFPALLPPDARAGVWSFSDRATPLVKFGPIDTVFGENILEAAKNLSDKGLQSNLTDAIITVTKNWWQVDEQKTKVLFIISDGDINLSAQAPDNRASRERLLNEILPKLRAYGVRIYCFALSEAADIELLDALSEQTKGRAARFDAPEPLIASLTSAINETSKIASYQNQKHLIEINSKAKLFSIVLENMDDSEVQLKDPRGRIYTQTKVSNNLSWAKRERKHLISITEPIPGTWELVAHLSPEKPYRIYQNLNLVVQPIPQDLLLGEKILITAAIQEKDTRVTDINLLQFLEMTAVLLRSDAVDNIYKLRDDGYAPDLYVEDGKYALAVPTIDTEGDNVIIFKAKTPTFYFEEKQKYTVHPTAATISAKLERKEDNFIRYGVTITPEGGFIDLAQTDINVKIKIDDRSENEINPQLEPNGTWYFPVNFKTDVRQVILTVNLTGKTPDQRPIKLALTPFIILNDPRMDQIEVAQKAAIRLSEENKLQKDIAFEKAMMEIEEYQIQAYNARQKTYSIILLILIIILDGVGGLLGFWLYKRARSADQKQVQDWAKRLTLTRGKPMEANV